MRKVRDFPTSTRDELCNGGRMLLDFWAVVGRARDIGNKTREDLL